MNYDLIISDIAKVDMSVCDNYEKYDKRYEAMIQKLSKLENINDENDEQESEDKENEKNKEKEKEKENE